METLTAQQLVARNVVRVRELRDVTQAQLARRLGWTKSTLSKLESGNRKVTVDDLLSLAFALDAAPSVLLAPWGEDDEQLRVENKGRGQAINLDADEAFGWITGAPMGRDLLLIADSPRAYLTTLPNGALQARGQEWIDHLREQYGLELTERGGHYVRHSRHDEDDA